jgi:tetratricopeptide (TPR) repeat protein/Zn-dependent protease
MFLVGIIVCFGWIFSLCLHEFSHAIVAYWGGDKSVKNKGYLTFNLLKYTDPGYSLILPIIFLLMGGIGLPGGAVYINQQKLRNRWWQSAVSAAGPLSNIIIAFGLAIPFWFFANLDSVAIERDSYPLSGLAFLVYLEVFATVFNLLPIPGLDGYGIVEPWLPKQMRAKLNYIAKYGTLFIIILFWNVPAVSSFIYDIVVTFTDWLHVPSALVSHGSYLFREPINKIISLAILLIIGWALNSGKNTWNSIQKGNREIGKGNYRSAILEFDRANEIDPNLVEAWTQKGYCLWCLGRQQEAATCYERSLAIDADNQYALQSLGHLLFDLTEYRSAIPHLQRTIELDEDRIESYYYLGTCWQKLDEPTLAHEVFGKAIAIEPTPGRENDWWFKAICLEQLGLADKAADCYAKVLKINASNQDVRSQIGIVYVNLGRYDLAVSHLTAAIELNDRDLNTHYYLGVAYRQLQELNLASAEFDRALALEPHSILVLHALGELLHHRQDYRAAISTHQKLVDLDSKDANGWYNLACCQALYGNANTAIYSLSKAIELEPIELKQSALKDPDFSSIAATEAFQKLIG